MNYAPLKKQFSKKGFEYEQMWRDDGFAIYRQSKKPINKFWYEAIKIRTSKGFKFEDSVCEPREIYPSSEQWGMFGFTYSNMEDANKRILKMKKELKKIKK